ncbi:MAG: type II toxin-antitoxin system VapC family toxin [Cytophagia bacterium]|nr:type II toxin-antitoxin system VapC family toxin [Cytophagia bacterium]NBW35733.1 type II toxin-antitoxin system VapC family toxin [Cytophagia bacterium]
MGLAEQLKGSNVYIDSAPLIYYFEKKQGFFSQLNELFRSAEKGELTLITSSITVTEVLTHPIRLRKVRLIKTYESFFEHGTSIKLMDVGLAEAKLAAELRAVHNLKTPDAIHIATDIESDSKFFLTNDFQLKKISNLEIVTLK